MELLKKISLIVVLILITLLLSMATLENGILLSIISFAIIIFFVKKAKIKKFSIFLIIFCLVTKITAILILDIPMSLDYQTMYDASQSTLIGNFSFTNSQYFTAYGYQLGHVFYQTAMLLICNSTIFLKILNCVYATIITLLIYLIVKKFAREDIARITSLIYAISLYPIYLNVILGNQQLGLMLFLLGIYILLTKENNIVNGIIIGLLFAFGNLERPEGIIYIITLIIYNIATLKNIKEIIKKTLPILITYFVIIQMASLILIKTNVNEIGFKNNDPYWKFVLGFSYEYNGKFNTPDYDNYAMKPNEEKQVIIDRISNIKQIPGLMFEKIKIQWIYDDLDKAFFATTTTQFRQEIVQIIVTYIKVMNLIIIAVAFIGLIKNKDINKINYFFIINIIIYFGVYLLIEVNARYYYNPQINIIILSAIGMERIFKFIENQNILIMEFQKRYNSKKRSNDRCNNKK